MGALSGGGVMREPDLVNGAARLLRFPSSTHCATWGVPDADSFRAVCGDRCGAVVALRSLAFMVGDGLTTNLAQINRATSASMLRAACRVIG